MQFHISVTYNGNDVRRAADLRPCLLARDRAEYLVQAVRGKSLLHVGCTDWPFTADRLTTGNLLHLKLREAARFLLGIDISQESLCLLRDYGCEDIAFMDAECITLDERFECILAGDVVEHLSNPGLFLTGACRHLAPDGELIVCVPSALSAACLKTWALGREDVHRDHICYFSPKTLSELCRRYGLLPTKLVFTTQPPSPHESRWYLAARKVLTRLRPLLSPSIIMHFKQAEQVDRSKYFIWE